MNEPASNTASSATHQSQAEARTTSSIPDITQLSLEPNPDIFTIVCCNDSFQLAIDHSTIKILLRVCKRARPLLSSKVPRFHSWSQNAGLCHSDGQLRIGLTPSDTIAISLHCDDQETADRSWLVAQAEHGNAAASYFLARILQIEVEGQPYMERSKRQSVLQQIFRFLENAAKGGHSRAQYDLAGFYLNGIEVDKDHTKAAELYRGPADRGIPRAQVALGRCYEIGEGVEQSYDTAIEWYSKAADQANEDGRLHILWIGICYSFGGGVSKDHKKAFEWFSRSADQGNSYGQWWVGNCYLCGRGVTEDERKAVEWFLKSAEQGNRYGQHYLGDCYRYGEGVPKNIDTTVFWWRKSADQGFQAAINNLKKLGKWP
ncbi:uncharacterized protein BJ171DRAFT_461222, partial [Polychytrium aggregatum]|uniref:uncharacterized protein n=1 Tax=Polychytrium aggregatum TaxID=110093 RepID=UPI0022FDC574